MTTEYEKLAEVYCTHNKQMLHYLQLFQFITEMAYFFALDIVLIDG